MGFSWTSLYVIGLSWLSVIRWMVEKSCTSQLICGLSHDFSGCSTIQGDAGFLPSTVSQWPVLNFIGINRNFHGIQLGIEWNVDFSLAKLVEIARSDSMDSMVVDD